jgi:hypothetical protein
MVHRRQLNRIKLVHPLQKRFADGATLGPENGGVNYPLGWGWVSDDDAADDLRYQVVTKSRRLTVQKLPGVVINLRTGAPRLRDMNRVIATASANDGWLGRLLR